MRTRLLSLSFLLASVATGLTWLSLQPTLLRLTAAVARRAVPGDPESALLSRVQTLLPYELAFNLLIVGALTYAVLHFVVGRPLAGTEALLEQLEHLNLDLPQSGSGGPLLARLRGSLQRTAVALRDAQRLSVDQLEELRQRNTQLVETQTELWAAERLATVGKLAAGVAHEVGTPLSGILGYVSLARAQVKDPELGGYLERIEAEVLRIDGIVRGLLDLGRPLRSELIAVDLGSVLKNAVQLMRAGPDFQNIQVELLAPESLWVRAEAGPLAQILINLLLNAAQAMGGTGTVTVRTTRDKEWVMVSVEDTGPGIPPDILPQVFEPFFTTKPSGKGSGLGLAISRHLAISLGGQLMAQNRAEGGATFAVRLLPA